MEKEVTQGDLVPPSFIYWSLPQLILEVSVNMPDPEVRQRGQSWRTAACDGPAIRPSPTQWDTSLGKSHFTESDY